MIVLLDTTVLIDCMRGNKSRPQLLAELVARRVVLATSAASVAELFAGLKPEHEARADALLRELEVIDVSYEIARQAGKLRYSWARRGKTLSLPDALIAATAIAAGAALATDNQRDFPMSGLELYPLPS